MNGGRALAGVCVAGVVVTAAVVTGSVIGTVRAVDDGVVSAVRRPAEAGSAGSVPATGAAREPVGPVGPATPDPGPAASTRLALGAAGSLVVAGGGRNLVVDRVVPAAGWTVDRVEDGGPVVEVRLRRGRAETRAEVRIAGDRFVVSRLRARDH